MIVENGKHYLYRHIRLDKNEVFYIGVGTKYGKGNPYYRSVVHYKRNSIWKRVVAKTEYKVEILLESDDYDFVLRKEIEFISLYGRKDLNTGTLTNLSDGGEGNTGVIVSEERKKKLSDRFKGKPCQNQKWWDDNKEHRKKGSTHWGARPIYQYDLEGNFIKEWGSVVDVERELNIKVTYTCVTNGGFQWKKKYEGQYIGVPNWENRRNTPRKVICYDEMNQPFICFSKIKEAAEFFGASQTTTRDAAILGFKLKRKYKIQFV